MSPGTSTPCQKPMVANRQVSGSAANRATSAGLGRSSWARTSTVEPRPQRLDRGLQRPVAGEQRHRAAAGRVDERLELVVHGRVEAPPSGGRAGGRRSRAAPGSGSRRGCRRRGAGTRSGGRPTWSGRRGGQRGAGEHGGGGAATAARPAARRRRPGPPAAPGSPRCPRPTTTSSARTSCTASMSSISEVSGLHRPDLAGARRRRRRRRAPCAGRPCAGSRRVRASEQHARRVAVEAAPQAPAPLLGEGGAPACRPARRCRRPARRRRRWRRRCGPGR